LERGSYRFGGEEHEAPEVAAAPDDFELDAAGRQQEVAVVGNEWRAFDRAVDAEAGERGVRRAGLEHTVEETEETDELGAGRRDDVFDVGTPRRELDDARQAIEIR